MNEPTEFLTKLRVAKDGACNARLFLSQIQGAVNTGGISRAKMGLAVFHLNECVRLIDTALGNIPDTTPDAPTIDQMVATAKEQFHGGKDGAL
jgi:hypothetical protein